MKGVRFASRTASCMRASVPRPTSHTITQHFRQPVTRSTSLSHQIRHIETIANCPESSCTCTLPPDLDIDRTSRLEGTTAFYNQHIVISTGTRDWPSRIEESSAVISGLKSRFHPTKGSHSSPDFKNLVSTSSFATSYGGQRTSALLFPRCLRVSGLYVTDSEVSPFNGTLDAFCSRYGTSNPPENPRRLSFLEETPLHSIVVLVCSHNARDTRCGIIGPILEQEIIAQAKNFPSIQLDAEPLTSPPSQPNTTSLSVGHISHIGGHKYAGNIIIYVPPSLGDHPLAGKGVWYGRVEPKHIRGILEETVLGGKVVQDLLRGGVEMNESGAVVPLGTAENVFRWHAKRS